MTIAPGLRHAIQRTSALTPQVGIQQPRLDQGRMSVLL
ncbi:hypothetical protein HNP55_004628 [Paucibacter oligotrophus]|uniref:Uncharacterized protein n=1 Tax=Roseateles oligotrophus TaxID=1769250 RepID=A0A840LBT5_9BURK|nr:hypothetical protein [Roseateles oligotrophus]